MVSPPIPPHGGVMPHAVQIAQLGRIAFEAGQGVAAALAQPLYLRNKIAYTSEERRAMNANAHAGAAKAGA
jgi:tRNA threonylcarbamoyladenosine biosynthesis protein TsaB